MKLWFHSSNIEDTACYHIPYFLNVFNIEKINHLHNCMFYSLNTIYILYDIRKYLSFY